MAEGRSGATLESLASSVGPALIDLHRDPDHHRSVFTLAGSTLGQATRDLAMRTIELVDIHTHHGVHPRLGALDVVPFAPLAGGSLAGAIAARDSFARWAADELGLPCFLYGPEATLPDIRRNAFRTLRPDFGPAIPHPSAGATCVGARPALVAYNLWLAEPDIARARGVANRIRHSELRVLAMKMGDQVQVSCNLVAPDLFGPAQAYDAVATLAPIARAELVGLIPASTLAAIPRSRWAQLDLSQDRTIEVRLARTG